MAILSTVAVDQVSNLRKGEEADAEGENNFLEVIPRSDGVEKEVGVLVVKENCEVGDNTKCKLSFVFGFTDPVTDGKVEYHRNGNKNDVTWIPPSIEEYRSCQQPKTRPLLIIASCKQEIDDEGYWQEPENKLKGAEKHVGALLAFFHVVEYSWTKLVLQRLQIIQRFSIFCIYRGLGREDRNHEVYKPDEFFGVRESV